MTAGRALSAVIKSCLTTLIFFAAAEAALRVVYTARNALVRRVPLPYSVGDDYGPVPPWLDRLMILAPDDTLIWRSLPNVRRTYVDIFSPAPSAAARTALLRRFMPTLPSEFRDNPTWAIALNSEGYRSGEVAAKPAGTVRIACIGDSWTFGMNVDQDRTYPSELAADLRRMRPDTNTEIVNFGVLGYSSFQGLQLLKSRVLDLHPDIVAIGFGMNDSEVAGYRDRDMVGGGPPRLATRVRDIATDFEFYKLLNYAALTLRFHPKSMGDFMREQANDRGSGKVDYDAIEPWTRVSPHDYEANLREMIRLSREHGAAVVLLDNELWEDSPYRPILRGIAADAGVPLVDGLRLIADARAKIERDLEGQLGLFPAQRDVSGPSDPAIATDARGRTTTVVFRVSRGAYSVPHAMSIVGTAPQLGDLEPNTVQMRDDGTGGDERAADGVWSLAAAFAPGTRVTYVYTNSGQRGRWEGLDIPHLRSVRVPASPDARPVYLPIETFGRVYMQADDWHTDATGYRLIGRAVADAIAATIGPRPATMVRARLKRAARSDGTED
jgi:lysophospholipase L1-like esterase